MPKSSYAEQINFAKVMISGLRSNAERVSKRGITKEFIDNLENTAKTAMQTDNEQEDLKAKLKTKTALLDSQMEDITGFMSEAKKAVKLEMEQEAWKSFGIDDKR